MRTVAGFAVLLVLVVVAAVGCDRESPGPETPAVPIPVPGSLEEVTEVRVRQAVEKAREQVAASPDSAGAWGKLGHVYSAHEWADEAVVCYRRAAELEPKNHRWRYYLGRGLISLDPDAAAEALGQFLEIDPRYPPAHVLRARALRQAGESDGARHHFQRALELQPNHVLATLGLGQLEAGLGNYDAARRYLEHALELDPRQSDAHKELARVCTALGDRDAAKHHAEAGLAPRPVEEMEDPLWMAIRDAGASATWSAIRGNHYLRSGNFPRAVKELEQAVSDTQDDPRFWLNYGTALLYVKRYEEAATTLESALTVRPSHEFRQLTPEMRLLTHVNLGIAQAQLHRLEAAQESFGQALGLDPGSADAATNLAILYARQGKLNDAIALLASVHARNPDPRVADLLKAMRRERDDGR